MRQIEQLLSAWPVLAMALLLALGLTVGAAASVHAGSRLRLEWMWVYFIGVPLAMVVGTVIRGRVLTVETFGVDLPDIEDYLAANWGTRIITLTCLVVVMERVLRFFVALEFRVARGLPLLAAILTYILVINFVSNIFGTASRLSHHLLYAPLFTLAIFAYAQTNLEQCLKVVRAVTLAFLLVSLAFLVIDLPMVAETSYRNSLIPGGTLRFYGFATHPNTLAPLCLMLMCCLFLRPFRSGWLNGLAWGVAWVSLLLTQSKTTIPLAVFIVAALYVNRAAKVARADESRRLGSTQQTLITWILLGLALAGVVVLAAVLAEPRVVDRLSQIGSSQQVISLSGRTTIWNETLKVVEENPLFGYGPGLWGNAFRLKSGVFVTHAHNQYYQTLGAAGILGLMSLLLYLAVLVYYGWRTRVASQGVTLALALFLVVRGITEVPLLMGTAMQSEFLLQMFLLVLCVGYLPPRRQLLQRENPAQRSVRAPLAAAEMRR